MFLFESILKWDNYVGIGPTQICPGPTGQLKFGTRLDAKLVVVSPLM